MDTFKQFTEFDKGNPEIFKTFKSFAGELLAAGRKQYSAKAIIERVRWDTDIKTAGSSFKINNNFAPYYARKLMHDCPIFKDFFKIRPSEADQWN
jgi:hypothetical protein